MISCSTVGLFRSLRRYHRPTRRQLLLTFVLCVLLSVFHRLPLQPYSIKDYFSHMRGEADLRNHYHAHGQRISLLDREGLPSGWIAADQQAVNLSSYAMKLVLSNEGSKRGRHYQGHLSRRKSRDTEGPIDKESVVSQRKATELGALDDVAARNNTKQRKRRKKRVKDMGVMATVAPNTVVGGDTPRSGATEKLVRTFQPTVKVS